MKKSYTHIFLMVLSVVLALCALPGSGGADEAQAEWTVLFYMCGSDLESRYSYATDNLEAIASCKYPDSDTAEIVQVYESFLNRSVMTKTGAVNVLVETGGCSKWHAQSLGMDISTKSLQRWRYQCYTNAEEPNGYYLEQTLPLQSMADPETLSDFIRWGAENYPAKKYALVLWDHGGGSKTGIFIDELFKGDIMYLDELGSALRDSGVHLEAVLFDACLMAGVETASAIADSAEWMIASEEVVAGKGTAIERWLHQLLLSPELNGEWLGRWICEMTQIKYADEGNEQIQQLLTWSVINLRKIPELVEVVDVGFDGMGKVFARYPKLMSMYARYIVDLEHFGTSEGDEKMWDLVSLLYTNELSMMTPAEIYGGILDTIKEAVVYHVHGTGRSGARGLSFCYAVSFSISELEIYARNCPMPHYLAFLDAITPWTAPDWVYEKADRLPEMSEMPEYDVTAKKVMLPDGTPALTFDENNYLGASSVRYNAYKLVEETGDIVSLGTMPAYYDVTVGENGVFQAVEPWLWPALEGQHVASYVVDLVKPGAREYLGSIPIQIGSEHWYLRYAFFLDGGYYVVYGLWNGYDTDSGLFNRNVKSLAQLVGQEYKLLYPIHNSEYEAPMYYYTADPQTIYRSMVIENKPAPPGKYYIQYVVHDMFMRPMSLDWIEINWDGEKATLSEGFVWEGEQELTVSDNYWNRT